MTTTASAREVRVPTDEGWLQGDLVLPEGFGAIVLFTDASGRHSAANRRVAQRLQALGIGSLLLDLLTAGEQQNDQRNGQYSFDVPLLTRRVQEAVEWLGTEPALRHAALGLFGSGSGTAAAMIAAARLGGQIAALVSRGGRPDLAGAAVITAVRAPTLLLVGSRDPESLAHNDAAYQQLRGQRSLAAVPGAGPLFDEPAALDTAAEMAADWFAAHFVALEAVTP